FETTPSVWHKEIIQVMADGIAVYGAASLGALRAAELAPFGMIGIGAIAQAYRTGQIERDDAVMVSHAPAELGHRAMTLALVDAEHAIAQVEMAADDRALLLRLARRMSFRDRSWALIGDAFRQATGRDLPPIDQWLSLKRKDAELLLWTIAGPVVAPRVAPPPQSFFLRSLRAEISAA
ncbi:TfuA-like protein, partial [Sphingobium yanoikuyae]|uniref:TfuA-like protein n=2 Tax=Sphingobium TaxID=165695 RepID=UPI002432AB08